MIEEDTRGSRPRKNKVMLLDEVIQAGRQVYFPCADFKCPDPSVCTSLSQRTSKMFEKATPSSSLPTLCEGEPKVAQKTATRSVMRKQRCFAHGAQGLSNAGREGIHGQLVAANWNARTPDATVCWPQAIRLESCLVYPQPDTAEVRRSLAAP